MRVAVVSHDAGASERIVDILARQPARVAGGHRCFYREGSPFAGLLRTEKRIAKECAKNAIDKNWRNDLSRYGPDLVVVGTGWQNRWHREAIQWAKERGLPTIAVMDHWSAYRERFGFPEKSWRKNLPEVVIVQDRFAYRIACELLAPSRVRWIEDYTFEKIVHAYRKALSEKSEKNRLLFLSEPTAEVARVRFGNAWYWGFDEMTVFREVLAFAGRLGLEPVVRLHPSDRPLRYREMDGNIQFSEGSLVEDLAEAAMVVGIDTVALYHAWRLGKRVVAFIPGNGRDWTIPLPQSCKTRSLVRYEPESDSLPQPIETGKGNATYPGILKELGVA